MCPLRKNRLAALKEDEQVGRAVVVNILNSALLLVRRVVELLHEIDAVVEVAIGLAAYEDTVFVVLVDIRSAIEVSIDGDFG
jgi:hypothetical protein